MAYFKMSGKQPAVEWYFLLPTINAGHLCCSDVNRCLKCYKQEYK